MYEYQDFFILDYRGHTTVRFAGLELYLDTGERILPTPDDRPCGYCKLKRTAEDHDGCLQHLNGVVSACCGHGEGELGYVSFDRDQETLRGQQAIDYFKSLGLMPELYPERLPTTPVWMRWRGAKEWT